MPLEKLTAFTKKVQDLSDKPSSTMTAAEVKAQFDAAPDEVRVYLNKLIEVLQSMEDGDSGADNINATAVTGLEGNTVQTILESLKSLDDTNRAYLLSQIQNTVLGQIPDGTITDEKLSDSPTGIKKMFNKHSEERASLTEVGHTKLSNAIDSASETLAATPKAVKEAYDRADQAFQSASDGKEVIASAVTDKGVPASPSDTFPTLATKIGQISTGPPTASGSQVHPWSVDTITVTGLSFKPKKITVKATNNPHPSVQGYYIYDERVSTTQGFAAYMDSTPVWYTITSITSSGFTIRIGRPQGANEHKFNWEAEG